MQLARPQMLGRVTYVACANKSGSPARPPATPGKVIGVRCQIRRRSSRPWTLWHAWRAPMCSSVLAALWEVRAAHQRHSATRRLQKCAANPASQAIIWLSDWGGQKHSPFAQGLATGSPGSVQQGLSAIGGALDFYRLGLAADKRYASRVVE